MTRLRQSEKPPDETAVVREELARLDFTRMGARAGRRTSSREEGVGIDGYVKDQVGNTRVTVERRGRCLVYDFTLPNTSTPIHLTRDPFTGDFSVLAPGRERRTVTYGTDATCPFCDAGTFGPKQLICGRRTDPVRMIQNIHPRGPVGVVLVEEPPVAECGEHTPRGKISVESLFWRNKMYARLSESMNGQQDALPFPTQLRYFVNWSLAAGGSIEHLHSQAQLVFVGERTGKLDEQRDFLSSVGMLQLNLGIVNSFLKDGIKPLNEDVYEFEAHKLGNPYLGDVYRRYNELIKPFRWTQKEINWWYRKLREMEPKWDNRVGDKDVGEWMEQELYRRAGGIKFDTRRLRPNVDGLRKLEEELNAPKYGSLTALLVDWTLSYPKAIVHTSRGKNGFIAYCPLEGEAREIDVVPRDPKITHFSQLSDEQLLELAVIEAQIGRFYDSMGMGWNMRVTERFGRVRDEEGHELDYKESGPFKMKFIPRRGGKGGGGMTHAGSGASISVSPEQTVSEAQPFFVGIEQATREFVARAKH